MKVKRVSNDARGGINERYLDSRVLLKDQSRIVIYDILTEGKFWLQSQTEPVIINRRDGYTFEFTPRKFGTKPTADIYVLYQNCIYKTDPNYNDEEVCLAVLEEVDKERKKFEALRNKFDKSRVGRENLKRVPIPEEVRILVWRRDQGRVSDVEAGRTWSMIILSRFLRAEAILLETLNCCAKNVIDQKVIASNEVSYENNTFNFSFDLNLYCATLD